MNYAHVVAERNTRDVVDNNERCFMESIYLDRDRVQEIKEMVIELGVSL